MSSCLERGGEKAHRHTAAGESATTSRILLALPQWAGRSDRVTPPMYTNLTCSGVDQFLSVGVDHFPNVANRADRKLLPVKRVMHYRGLSARRPGPAHRRTLENTALIKKYYPGSPDFGVFLPWPRFGSSTSGSFVHPVPWRARWAAASSIPFVAGPSRHGPDGSARRSCSRSPGPPVAGSTDRRNSRVLWRLSEVLSGFAPPAAWKVGVFFPLGLPRELLGYLCGSSPDTSGLRFDG
jgi:hypothetical protein